MDNWQDNLTRFIPVVVFIGTLNMVRDFLAFEIEEQIGRQLTDWEWKYFLQERNRKREVEARQQIVSQWRESLAVRQKIHDFVWNRHF
jgi:ABC-type bacteriocin/lantibiotic exporter with double-glycine peptidase domain